ncbi:MAG: serine protease [Rhodospirillales bacterium]
MAEPRFLLKTDLGRFDSVAAPGGPVTGQYAALRERLAGRGRAAVLFAEPVAGAGAISWYGEGSGDPQPITALSPSRRAEAEAQLSAALAAIDPLLDDPQAGPLLRRALVIGEAENIVVDDDGVILTGWGLAPKGTAGDEALAAHLRATLGRYSPRLAAADATFFAPVAAPRPAAPAPAAPMAAAAAPAAPPTRPVAAAAPAAHAAPVAAAAPRPWWMIPAFATVALIFLILGFWLAWTHLVRDMAGRELSAGIVDEERTKLAIRLQRETNEALEREVERARQAAQSPNVCRAEGSAQDLMPVRPQNQPVPPAAVPPTTPSAPDQQAKPFTGSLADLMEHATVMIVTAGAQGVGHGSGFFVAGDTVVTNAHVVEGAAPDQVFVMSKSIGRALKATVVAQSTGAGGKAEPGKPDFAVLKLPEAVPGSQPLAMTRTAEKLLDVVAAGYPASVVRVEAGMAALREGRLGEPPELVLTRGSISTIQNLQNGLIVMPHSADISPGNSGGPLVDACGRVVGINTFVSRATEVADRVKYAQKADSVLDWLQQQNVAVQTRDGACRPEPPTATPPTAQAPTAPGAAPDPGATPNAAPAPGTAPNAAPKPAPAPARR